MKRSAIKRLAMERSAVKRSAASEGESGFVLLAVIFLTVVLLISLAIAAPKIAKSIQRDKELETIHRGEQYKRALKLYYQKLVPTPHPSTSSSRRTKCAFCAGSTKIR